MRWVNSMGLVGLLAFVFGGCAPTVIEGRKVDSEKLKEMTVDQIDKAKVEDLFGKPSKVERESPDIEKYFYTYRAKKPTWYTIDQTQGQDFEVCFQNGILKYYRLQTEVLETVLKQ